MTLSITIKHSANAKPSIASLDVECCHVEWGYTELHNVNSKLCSKQQNKVDLLHLIVVPLAAVRPDCVNSIGYG